MLRRLVSVKAMSKKLNYPSADRNKHAILEIMQKYIDPTRSCKMLEVSSGTGQHAKFYATQLPLLTIQTSEFDVATFDSIKEYASEVEGGRVKAPVYIDASKGPWPVDTDYDYVLNVNMFHVAPWECSVGFFKYAPQVLKPGGVIFTYGAVKVNGVLEPQSNVDFDKSIRARDPLCGVRDVVDLQKLAEDNGVVLLKMYDMPANNKCCVWQKS